MAAAPDLSESQQMCFYAQETYLPQQIYKKKNCTTENAI